MAAYHHNGNSSNGHVHDPDSDTLRIFAVSDVVEPQIYTSGLRDWLGPVDLIISCGDLPPNYLDFLVSLLDVPMYHVLGNHCFVPHDPVSKRCSPAVYSGAQDLNGRLAEHHGLIMGGVEGSPQYNGGPHQYNEQQMELNLLRLVPGMMLNKMRTGRYLDIFVTHSPPRGIHDNEDHAHRGFATFIPFIERFKPALMLHGHTHRYNPMLPMRSRHGETVVINAYGHAIIDLERDPTRPGWRVAGSLTARGLENG